MSQNEVAQLKNLGTKSAEMLANVGVTSSAQIRQLGSVGCYLLVKTRYAKTSLNLLWAVEGFLLDLDWRDIPEERKTELRTELNDVL